VNGTPAIRLAVWSMTMPKPKLQWYTVDLVKSPTIARLLQAELQARDKTSLEIAKRVAQAHKCDPAQVKVGRGFDNRTPSYAIDDSVTAKPNAVALG
jgi:hypothetical protein